MFRVSFVDSLPSNELRHFVPFLVMGSPSFAAFAEPEDYTRDSGFVYLRRPAVSTDMRGGGFLCVAHGLVLQLKVR